MSDKKITEQIEALLKDEMLKNTLVPAALQDMLDALDSNEIVIKDQEETIEALNKKEKNLREEYQGVKAARDDYQVELTELKNRIEDLEARELACSRTEIENMFERRRGDEFKELMHATVRNPIVKRQIMGGMDSVMKDGYTDSNGLYQQPRSETVSKGTTDETETVE